MGRARTSFLLLLALVVSLVPGLFLVDLVVQRQGQRQAWLEGELRVRLDGQDALFLPVSLVQIAAPGRPDAVVVEHAEVLRQDRYPWLATTFEGRFRLRLEPEFFSATKTGVRREDFAATYTVRQTGRADGLGLPPVPCSGYLYLRELQTTSERPVGDLADLNALAITMDLLCTGAGPDLEFDTGDEQTWAIEGSLRLRQGKLKGAAAAPSGRRSGPPPGP